VPLSFRMHKHPVSGLIGCTVGMGNAVYVGSFGGDMLDALHAGATVASALQQQMKTNPALAAVLPPGTGVALQAITAASAATKAGATPQQAAAAAAAKHGAPAGDIVSDLFHALGL
jgi:hypothetical protein